jgi:DNA-binding LacI/PurR family transcriptional regulator
VDRLEGYRNVLGRHGIPYDENLVVEGDFSQESGEFACRQLLERKREFDAIFAANDEMAFASLKVLEEHAIEVPSDVALVGFDDISFSRIIKPPLTTVSQPMTEVGRLAATRLIDLLDGKTVEPDIVEFPTKLVVRKSCGC